MNTLGRNRTFPIYKSDGTSFHDLVLHKSTCESVVMSLGDKITGDVYYKDNTLAVTMQEYIKFKVNPDDVNEDEVKYVLVSPPTVIREGMVSDNSELKGMTKYSFTFYHPMYMLGNFPFTDIAVLPDPKKYLSQNKTFSWIGSLAEFVAKLNKNLENTEWVVSIASSVVLSKRNEIPEKPLSFDKQYISDALKTCYDTWKVPFTVSPIKNGETHYSQGKRFLIQFGNPTEAIYEVDEQGQKTSTEYIFRFGQGVGLKNNSRTPRNNKIVTRIVGYGSERNIPYGYPQIPWYGNQDWDYTVDNDPNDPNSYPIYWGIYGGQYIKLIKHPFTRTTLMPSVYSQDVFNKVSPYIQGGEANVNCDPSIEIHDYYDAIDDQTHLYPNNINPLAPSVEIHQFEDEYPHLLNMKIKAVEPYNDKYEYDSKKYTKITLGAFNLRITADMQATSNMNERAALGRLQNAINGSGTEFHETTNHASSYAFQCDASKVGDIWYVEYTSDNVNYNYAASNSFPVVKWDDTMDKDGNYNQSYFKITLPRLTFDLYACASIMEQMDINMRSGDCLGCTFPIQVDWDDYKANFYRADGTFDPVIHTSPNDGHVRDGIKYPDSSVGSIEIIVQKDIGTFGTLMPNTYQQPKGESAEGENDGDQFVILGISLPLSYITEAEERLDESMKQYMLENNVHYYDYPLKFDEHFLAENTGILAQIQNNVKVKFQYGGSITSLFIKQVVIKFGEKVLPQYDITLTDDIEVVMSSLGQTTEDVSKLRVQMSELQKYYSENIINEINDKLSRIIDDVCLGRITFQQGLDSIGNTIFHEDARSVDYSSGLGGRGWRVDKLGNAEFESVRIRSFLEVIELLINRQQAQEGDTVFSDNDQIDRVDQVVDENDGSVSYILSLKEKWDGYVTAQMYGNILKGVINTLAAKQSGVSDESGSSQGQGSDDGGNEFYTSWMHVVGTNATEPSLGVNQIRVVLYGDSDVPAQKNFPPCELMVIARRGCINYATPSSPQSVKDSIERRQRFFEISVTEGRVTKYTNVDRPVIQNGSYGVTIGELPDFVKRYAAVSRVLAQVGEHTDWLYAQGIVVGNMIKIDREGNLEVNYVDCGEWVDGSQIQEPTPRHGVYYYNTWNETAQQQETHDVWHNNAKWRCLQNQPVTVGGVTTYYEPSDANSYYWLKLEEGVAGTSPYFADLGNGMDSVPCTNSGTATSAYDQIIDVGLWYGSEPIAISSMSYKVNNSTTYSDSRTIDGITVTPSAENKTIRIQVASGATLAEHNDIEIIVAGSGSGSKELHFILNGVRAGSNGENAVIYNLKPSPDSINVAREDDGRYTPSTASIRCGYVKNDGGVMTEASTAYGLIDNTYRVYFRAKTRSNHAWAANFGLCTAAVSAPTNTVEAVEFVLCSRKEGVADFDSPISEATLSSNYNIIDRETVLIVADGMKGDDGGGSATAYATPSQITVQCDGSGNVVSQSDNSVDFSLKVGGETATITGIAYGTLPSGVSIIGSSGTSRTIRINTSATASSMSNGVTFTVTGTYDGETFSAPVTVALIGTKQGDTVWNQTAYKYFMDGETLDKPTKTSGITPATTDFYNDWYSTPQNTKSVTKNTYVNNSGLNTDIGDMSVWRDLVSTDEEYGVYGAGWRVARGNQSDSSDSKHVIDKVCFTPTSNNEYFVLYIAADAEMGYDGVFVSDINPSSYSESNWSVSSLSTYNRTANSVLKIVINVTNKKNTLCWFYITYKKDESGYAGSNDSGYYKLEKSIGFSVYSSFATIQNGSVVGTWSNAEKWQGSDGKMGRSYYYATEFDKNNTTDVFVVSNAQAPYFKTSENSYYTFNYNADGGYTMAQMWSISNGSFNNEPWEVMNSDFKYLITEAVFGDYAHFGANIINADYRYSQYGFMRGLGNVKANISDSSQYKNIDPNDPFGTEEFLNDSRKIRNESFVGYEMLTPNHYSIVGCLIEFSSSSSSSYGHSIYESGDSYFRYKTKGAYQWGSWIAFGSDSYSFAISSNKNDTSSSTSSFSWQTYPPVPTASQPYLWLKTGSSSCMRVSSRIANFRFEKNEWYTVEIDAEYQSSMNLSVRIGNNTRGRYIILSSNMKKYELTDNDRTIVCYAIFKYEGVTINDANVWLSSFDGYVNFVAVYKAQFVPYLCEDLKVGKLVVNDIVARGELHGESLYFKHASAFHRVYVHDESILSIPHAHDNEITTIVLPSPTESNGRVIEVYSGLEDGQSWSPTWDGASSGDYFRSFVCNTGGVGAGGTWSATYVKFWSDGSYWYVLKAERAIYDSDNDRHIIQLISKTH